MINAHCPILGFVAYSGTGKTTLLQKLIPLLKKEGLKLGMIKHAHHQFDIDIPGKDSYELRKAGADQVLVASQKRWAMITETADNKEDPDLQAMVNALQQNKLDLILVEGFKHIHFPKIELHRPSMQQPLLFPNDSNIIALATDAELSVETSLPVLDLNSPTSFVRFIQDQVVK